MHTQNKSKFLKIIVALLLGAFCLTIMTCLVLFILTACDVVVMSSTLGSTLGGVTFAQISLMKVLVKVVAAQRT